MRGQQPMKGWGKGESGRERKSERKSERNLFVWLPVSFASGTRVGEKVGAVALWVAVETMGSPRTSVHVNRGQYPTCKPLGTLGRQQQPTYPIKIR